MVDLPTDRGFSRSLSARVENAFPARRESVGLQQFDEDDFEIDGDIGVFDSIGAAAASSGVVIGTARRISQGLRPDPEPDFDLDEYLETREDHKKALTPFLQRPDRAGSLLTQLVDARSRAEVDRIMQNLSDSQQRLREAQANGFLPELVGNLAGIGVDIVPFLAAAMLSGGSAGFPLIAARSGIAARSTAAARLGAIGAAEGAAERAAQGLTNPLVTDKDILEAAGIGAGAASLLGFAFPTLFGGAVRVTDDIVEMSDEVVKDAAEVSGRSVSAAATPPGAVRGVQEPAKGAGSVIVSKVPGLNRAEGFLRNPKRAITDIGVRGSKDFAEKGLKGGRKFFDLMSKTVRLSTVNADEVGGAAARQTSVQDLVRDFRVNRIAREEAVKREYSAAVEDIYAASSIGRAVKNSVLTPSAVRNRQDLISQEEFEAMADELGIALANKLDGEVNVIPDDVSAALTPEQRIKLLEHLKATAQKENAYYQEYGRAEVSLGLLDENDLIPGYRPQRWNREVISNDPQGFEQFLRETFSLEPDDAWVRKNFLETAEDGKQTPILKEGETFAQLVARDPELADEILDEWSAGLRQASVVKAVEATQRVVRELKKLRGKSLQEIERRLTASLEPRRARLARLEARLADGDATDVLATKIGKLEKKIADEELKLQSLRSAARSAGEIDGFIRRFGNNKQRRKLAKLTAQQKRAVRREAQKEAQRLVSDQIRDIRRAITEGDNPTGFVPDEFVATSGRFKRRNINLGRMRFTPQARRFLLTNSHDARAAFDHSVAPQIAMRKVFGDIGRQEGESFQDAVRRTALEGFDEDLRRTPGDARIGRERRRAEGIFDRIFGELTGADLLANSQLKRTVSDTVSIINTAQAAMSLGGVVLAQLGDLAVQAVAGGRLGTGFRAFWRNGRVISAIREIAEKDDQLAVLIQGASTLDASRFRAIADLDRADFDIPGGMMRKVSRVTNEIGVIEGWANLMHVWNRIVRGGFGLDFARQIDEDLANWSGLPDHLKTFYAKVGFDGDDAREFAELMNRSHTKAVNGKLRLPNQTKWSEARPDLLEKYRVAIQTAGDEAMIDPSIGDRPFMRSSAVGRLVLQFQSFMFTAGERFIAPMIQEAQLHPTSVRPVVAALAGLQLGIITDGLKSAVRGEGEAWLDRWNTEEGFRDNLWGGVLRSPMMAGMSSSITDVALTNLARPLNDVSEDVLGVKPFRQSATRFRESQGAFALLGPSAGFFLGTVPSIGRKALEGNVEDAAEQLSRRIPVMNVFYLQLLAKLARDE